MFILLYGYVVCVDLVFLWICGLVFWGWGYRCVWVCGLVCFWGLLKLVCVCFCRIGCVLFWFVLFCCGMIRNCRKWCGGKFLFFFFGRGFCVFFVFIFLFFDYVVVGYVESYYMCCCCGKYFILCFVVIYDLLFIIWEISVLVVLEIVLVLENCFFVWEIIINWCFSNLFFVIVFV